MPLKYIVRVDLNVKASQNLGSQLKKKKYSSSRKILRNNYLGGQDNWLLTELLRIKDISNIIPVVHRVKFS